MSKEKANERINSRVTISAGRKSHGGIIIIISAVIVCLLVGVILYLVLGKTDYSPNYNRVITPDNVEQVINQMDKESFTPIGSYQVTMNTDWVFPNGDSASSNAYVENNVSNQNTVYFTIAIKGTENDIYKSPYLTVGSHLEAIKLDSHLNAGSYDTVLTYHLVDDDFKDISSVSVSLTLIIEN